MSDSLRLTRFSDIAVRFLQALGYEPHECGSEDEARDRAQELIQQRKWPCYFFASDTTGEKDFEEFFTEREELDMDRFAALGVIRNKPDFDGAALDEFTKGISGMLSRGAWTRAGMIDLFNRMIPEFNHRETGKFLDGRM